jgi:hypothetical protein
MIAQMNLTLFCLGVFSSTKFYAFIDSVELVLSRTGATTINEELANLRLLVVPVHGEETSTSTFRDFWKAAFFVEKQKLLESFLTSLGSSSPGKTKFASSWQAT